MFEKLARLAEHIALTFAPPPLDRRAVSRFRPNLEILDARVVPTANNWVGGISSDASVAANWSLNHVPLAGEDVLFVPYVVPLSPPTSVDCNNFSGPATGGKFNSVYLDDAYTAKVTLSQGFDTKALQLRNGTLDQPELSQDETDITVTGSPTVDIYNQYYLTGAPDFKWTGGTLNSTSHAAELILQGATGVAAPVNAGAVSTADTIRLVSDAILTFEDGTYTFTAGEGIPVDSGQVNFEIGNGGVEVYFTGSSIPQGKITLPTGSGVSYTREVGFEGLATMTEQMPVIVTGGAFTVGDNVKLTVTGRVGGTDGANVSVQDGITRLYQSSILVVPNGMGVSGGSLTTVNNGSSNDQTAMIDGNLLISGGFVTIDEGKVQGHHFGRLLVVGDITWIGGVFRPLMDGTPGSELCDQLWVGGTTHKFIIDGGTDGARVGPAAVLNNQANLLGRTWPILKTDGGGFQNLQGGVPQLPFETADEGNVWDMQEPTATTWLLRRKRN